MMHTTCATAITATGAQVILLLASAVAEGPGVWLQLVDGAAGPAACCVKATKRAATTVRHKGGHHICSLQADKDWLDTWHLVTRTRRGLVVQLSKPSC